MIALIALAITVIPGGDNATETVFTALTMGFLVAIAFFVYRLHQENQLSIYTLSDRWRAVLYGAIGGLALMVAGADEMLETGLGTLAWIAVIALSIYGLVLVYREARSY